MNELSGPDKALVALEQWRQRELSTCSLTEFLNMDISPREYMLGPWLPVQGICMVYATRGVGKTFFALAVGHAVASGGRFLDWEADKPRGVLYIDGEMPATVLQQRLNAIVRSSGKGAVAPFEILTPDLQGGAPMPDLATEDGRARVDKLITDEIKLIVIDNISTLSNTKENEADGWANIQAWALRHRAAGKTVLFIHHAGKGGAQRGTSAREDVLDTVIVLKNPADYEPSQGARFEVHFEKSRGMIGDDVKPFEVLMVMKEDSINWQAASVEAKNKDRILELAATDMSQKDIANELGLSKGYVSKVINRR